MLEISQLAEGSGPRPAHPQESEPAFGAALTNKLIKGRPIGSHFL